MAAYLKGDIVTVRFPFSSQESYKIRPALVIASWFCRGQTDYLLALISTQKSDDPNVVELETTDFNEGVLSRKSYVRPAYLWAAGENVIRGKACSLKQQKMAQVIFVLRTLIV